MPVDEIQKTIQPECSQTLGIVNYFQPPRHHRHRWSENSASCLVAYGLLGSENLTKSIRFVHRFWGLQICECFIVEKLVDKNQLKHKALVGFFHCFVCFVMLIQSQLLTLKLCDICCCGKPHTNLLHGADGP